MTFYEITHSGNKNIIGHYPQVKSIINKCNVWEESKFIGNFNFEKIDFKPIVSNPVLYKSSKLTDLIQVVGFGFHYKLLLSNKLKNILEQHYNNEIQFFQTDVIHNKIFYKNYYLLNIIKSNMELIDFKKSYIIGKKKSSIGKFSIEELKIESLKKFTDEINKNYYYQVVVEKIALKNSVNYDFFVLKNVSGGVKFVVSSKLKKVIEFEKCTGIEFKPIELTLNEWLQSGEREKIYGKA